MKGNSGETLRKWERIKKKREFDEIFTEGKFFGGSYVSLVYRFKSPRRVGFALGKGIKGSVSRNRLKRLLREIYRKNKSELKDDVELVLIAKETAIGKGYLELKEDLDRLFHRAEILK